MELHVKLDGTRELSAQIYRQIRAAILDGRLPPGERLPPTRELAQRLEVSRNTVTLAYEWLTSQGLVSGRVGAGSYVEGEPSAGGRARATTKAAAEIPFRSIWRSLPADFGSVLGGTYDLRPGVPDSRLFPFEAWRRLVARQLHPSRLKGTYGHALGHPNLRAAIARHVGVSRGVRADADNVIVTNGTQHGLDLVSRLFLEPGMKVAMEDPGYTMARLAFRSHGAEVLGVPVDAEGLVVSAIPDHVRFVYVTPSHQYPLGMPMSHGRRVELLAWAERRNAAVIEDDYDSEFRFGGRPLDSLQAIDRGGRVIYVGSFSKVMLPSLRLGFLVAPDSLRDPLRRVNFITNSHCHWPAQAALAAFIDDGLLARHLRKMRREYGTRHDRIFGGLGRDFGEWFEPIPSLTGMHLTAKLRSDSVAVEREIVAKALAAGIGIHGLSDYYVGEPALLGLVIGYGGIATAQIDAALRRLREICATCVSSPSARPPRHRDDSRARRRRQST